MTLRAFTPGHTLQHPSHRTGIFEKLLTIWFASYRPEKHYMRGPGPKWHEKHRGTFTRAPAGAAAAQTGAGGGPGTSLTIDRYDRVDLRLGPRRTAVPAKRDPVRR